MSQTTRPRKVLVLGALGFSGIDCRMWSERNLPNIADFDIVLVNGPSLTPLLRRAEQIRATSSDKDAPWDRLDRLMDRNLGTVKDRLRALLASGGIIFAIVPKRELFHLERKDSYPYVRGLDAGGWLPFEISFDEHEGDTLEVLDGTFARYLGQVRRWHFSVNPPDDQAAEAALGDKVPPGYSVLASSDPIAVNRQKQAIATRFRFRIMSEWAPRAATYFDTPSENDGRLVLLPPTTETTGEEAIRILLEDFCGLEARTPEPDFVKGMRVPGEDHIDTQITEKSERLAVVQQEIDALGAEKARRRRFLALTYEKGIEGLQNVVRDAFEEVGLKTREADPDVSDEFMVGDGTSEALVEVKGHKKSAQKGDIRQLDESLDEYEKKYGGSVKGILVVNAWCETPVEDREKPGTMSFPDNVIQRAEAIGAALVSGVELYTALCAVWSGQLTGGQVFSRLMKGRGVTRLT